MLKLVNITKDYPVANTTVRALKGVSLNFRKNEFVSILGPSGCGKTTLLNIIGGLDHYTDGDLVISGKSTKAYRDGDWDSYRNHRIGFIFQSYNLIPHQTILGNVELALTIGGMSASARKKKAKEALKKVGLGNEVNKLPNQLSGGQMQRVAIARALVNDPEILLADEPTGALDTQTSVQIMEIIKEIAQDKLVIMVTHNPELANKYSSRIIRLLDGKVTQDSNPYNGQNNQRALIAQRLKQSGYTEEQINDYFAYKDGEAQNKEGKTNMSFLTSLALSAKNLWSKKGRTAITAVAGSIGIIGVCLVLALSAGIRGYIASMQDDMLSGNPIMIQETAYNLDALTDAMNKDQKEDIVKENGRVYIDSYVESLAEMGSNMASMLVNNNITAEYVDYIQSMPKEYYAAMTVDYGVDVTHSIYTDFTFTDTNGQPEVKNMSIGAIQSLYTEVLQKTDFKDYVDYVSMFTDIFAQAPNNAEYIASQYDIVSGKVATQKNEIMIVLDRNGETTDLTLAQLGYLTQEQFLTYAYKATDNPYDQNNYVNSFSNAEICGKTFTWYPNDSIYTQNTPDQTNQCAYMYQAYGDGLSDGLELKVVGILQPKETISYGCLRSGIYYTQALAEYMIEQNKDSQVLSYVNNEDNKGTVYSGYYSYTVPGTEMTFDIPIGIGYNYSYVFEGTEYPVFGFVGGMSDYALLSSMMGGMMGSLGGGMGGSSGAGAMMDMKTFTSRQMGGEEIANNIYLYPVSFETKNLTTDYLNKWNAKGDLTYFSISQNKDVTLSQEDREQVAYTDTLELIINMLNSMIDIITTGLVAFTSISLVVSSVMIGVITYVSVVERTKEIGVLRSLGARKKDISNLFNAETFIIGLLAGVFGVAVTYLLSVPINFIIGSITGIYSIAALPVSQAVIMICVSFILTMISGLFPARAAAKKDPVIALRTE
ncbi:MAG: ABC transporter ATP-binding protein/permease [Clostridia bacterium]|nr:ABC transporter ATP-binding protein/permease [Clostridia bacterium]